MTEPTIADDIAEVRRLADRLDPDVPWDQTGPSDVDVADMLRRIAAHMERITTGGDRAAPDLRTPAERDADEQFALGRAVDTEGGG